ncbi:MAG: hypothetical protein C4562_04835 [Actinobacteria bacterium]|nr:MAG: hypothetical protein C4562_04835 [Actinomycetota bacterium]
MDAFEELRKEHSEIMRLVSLMKHTVAHLRANQELPEQFVQDMLDFITGFADKCHHGKEEKVLFPLLKSRQLSQGDLDLIDQLLEDHAQGRSFVAAMKESFKLYQNGDSGAVSELADNMESYANLLPGHIKKEAVFFKHIQSLLTPKELALHDEKCEKIEKELGEHEHFLELMDRMRATAMDLFPVN